MAETNQPTGEPFVGVNTSPTTFRPHVLHIDNQHAANYIRIMVKSGMNPPHGEDQSVPLITEVLSLLSPYATPIPYSILLLALLVINLFTHHCFCFHSALQKIRLANHICSLAELLHVDVIQQLELALLSSPVTRLLDVLVMGTQQQTVSSRSTSVPLHPSTTLSMPSSPPSVPIAGTTDMEGPVEAKASTSKITPPATSADTEVAFPKHCQIIPVPIPMTTSRSSSLPSKLPVVVVPKLTVLAHTLPEWINCPGGCKDYRCQLCAFQSFIQEAGLYLC